MNGTENSLNINGNVSELNTEACRGAGNTKAAIPAERGRRGNKNAIILRMVDHSYEYEVRDILRLFFSAFQTDISLACEDIKSLSNDMPENTWILESVICRGEQSHLPNHTSQTTLESQAAAELSQIMAICTVLGSGVESRAIAVPAEPDLEFARGNQARLEKHLVKRSIFDAFYKILPVEQPWGILTGIRPTKIVYDLWNKGLKNEEIPGRLQALFRVSEKKAKLITGIAEVEKGILERTPENSVSVYIGIPFCPTRCLYCSFASNSMTRWGHLMEPYLQALFQEMDAVALMIKELNFKVQSVYIGGGTPTSLSEEQLKRLFDKIDETIIQEGTEEYTLEAGRPDTITPGKLRSAIEYGVTRISINPQSMNQDTLDRIGRKHSPGEIVKAFCLARDMGFDNINMDIIAGLPGEDSEDFRMSLEEIRKLGPDSLTVHTMAVKRASRLNEEQLAGEIDFTPFKEVEKMVEMASEEAAEMGLRPYYLYRQKNMVGNLENTGYSKPGKECIYNIQMMEERQTNIALGADAVTKVYFPEENRLERAFNVKNVEAYIDRVDEMIDRKRRLLGLTEK